MNLQFIQCCYWKKQLDMLLKMNYIKAKVAWWWFKTGSSTVRFSWVVVTTLHVTITVSKNYPAFGEHVIICRNTIGYHSNIMRLLNTPLITALEAYNSKMARWQVNVLQCGHTPVFQSSIIQSFLTWLYNFVFYKHG